MRGKQKRLFIKPIKKLSRRYNNKTKKRVRVLFKRTGMLLHSLNYNHFLNLRSNLKCYLPRKNNRIVLLSKALWNSFYQGPSHSTLKKQLLRLKKKKKWQVVRNFLLRRLIKYLRKKFVFNAHKRSLKKMYVLTNALKRLVVTQQVRRNKRHSTLRRLIFFCKQARRKRKIKPKIKHKHKNQKKSMLSRRRKKKLFLKKVYKKKLRKKLFLKLILQYKNENLKKLMRTKPTHLANLIFRSNLNFSYNKSAKLQAKIYQFKVKHYSIFELKSKPITKVVWPQAFTQDTPLVDLCYDTWWKKKEINRRTLNKLIYPDISTNLYRLKKKTALYRYKMLHLLYFSMTYPLTFRRWHTYRTTEGVPLPRTSLSKTQIRLQNSFAEQQNYKKLELLLNIRDEKRKNDFKKVQELEILLKSKEYSESWVPDRVYKELEVVTGYPAVLGYRHFRKLLVQQNTTKHYSSLLTSASPNVHPISLLKKQDCEFKKLPFCDRFFSSFLVKKRIKLKLRPKLTILFKSLKLLNCKYFAAVKHNVLFPATGFRFGSYNRAMINFYKAVMLPKFKKINKFSFTKITSLETKFASKLSFTPTFLVALKYKTKKVRLFFNFQKIKILRYLPPKKFSRFSNKKKYFKFNFHSFLKKRITGSIYNYSSAHISILLQAILNKRLQQKLFLNMLLSLKSRRTPLEQILPDWMASKFLSSKTHEIPDYEFDEEYARLIDFNWARSEFNLLLPDFQKHPNKLYTHYSEKSNTTTLIVKSNESNWDVLPTLYKQEDTMLWFKNSYQRTFRSKNRNLKKKYLISPNKNNFWNANKNCLSVIFLKKQNYVSRIAQPYKEKNLISVELIEKKLVCLLSLIPLGFIGTIKYLILKELQTTIFIPSATSVISIYWGLRFYLNNILKKGLSGAAIPREKNLNQEINLLAKNLFYKVDLINHARYRCQPLNLPEIRRDEQGLLQWLRTFFPKKYAVYVEDTLEYKDIFLSESKIFRSQLSLKNPGTWNTKDLGTSIEFRIKNLLEVKSSEESSRFETILATIVHKPARFSLIPDNRKLHKDVGYFIRLYSSKPSLIILRNIKSQNYVLMKKETAVISFLLKSRHKIYDLNLTPGYFSRSILDNRNIIIEGGGLNQFRSKSLRNLLYLQRYISSYFLCLRLASSKLNSLTVLTKRRSQKIKELKADTCWSLLLNTLQFYKVFINFYHKKQYVYHKPFLYNNAEETHFIKLPSFFIVLSKQYLSRKKKKFFNFYKKHYIKKIKRMVAVFKNPKALVRYENNSYLKTNSLLRKKQGTRFKNLIDFDYYSNFRSNENCFNLSATSVNNFLKKKNIKEQADYFFERRSELWYDLTLPWMKKERILRYWLRNSKRALKQEQWFLIPETVFKTVKNRLKGFDWNTEDDSFYRIDLKQAFSLRYSERVYVPWLEPLMYKQSLYATKLKPYRQHSIPREQKRLKSLQYFRKQFLTVGENKIYIKGRRLPRLNLLNTKLYLSLLRLRNKKAARKHFKKRTKHTTKTTGFSETTLGFCDRYDVNLMLIGLAPTIYWARVLAKLGLVKVNGLIITSENFRLKPGDTIQFDLNKITKLMFNITKELKNYNEDNKLIFKFPDNYAYCNNLETAVFLRLPRPEDIVDSGRVNLMHFELFREGLLFRV